VHAGSAPAPRANSNRIPRRNLARKPSELLQPVSLAPHVSLNPGTRGGAVLDHLELGLRPVWHFHNTGFRPSDHCHVFPQRSSPDNREGTHIDARAGIKLRFQKSTSRAELLLPIVDLSLSVMDRPISPRSAPNRRPPQHRKNPSPPDAFPCPSSRTKPRQAPAGQPKS